MTTARLKTFLACVLALALLSLAFAGGLAGCGEKNTPEGEETNIGQNNGQTDSAGPSGIALVRDFYKVCIVNPDGSGERQLTNDPSCAYGNLAFSPSGKKLAATKTQGDSMPDLVVIDVGNGSETNYYLNQDFSPGWNTAGVVPWFGSICWAGENVLYLTTEKPSYDLYQVAKLDTSARRVEVVVENAKNPSLSPDGKKLAYIALPSDWAQQGNGAWVIDSPGDLMVRDLASGSTQKIAVNRGDGASRGYVFEAVFSPDGKHLMATCSDEPDTELYYTDLEGKVLATPDMIGTSGRFGHPSFSPDGSKLVFHSEVWKDGYSNPHYYKVFTATANASMSPPTEFDLGEGAFPAWGPPGTGTGAGTENGFWKSQSSGTTVNLNGVSAVSTMVCWAVGDGGTILRTVTGGEGWYAQPSGTTADLMAVSAVDAYTCWAVGTGVVLKTTDGGESWKPQDYGSSTWLESVSVVDRQTCWAVGAEHGHAILRTTNGGSSWTLLSMSDPALIAISAIDADVAYAAGGSTAGGGNVSMTSNAGETWSEAGLDTSLAAVCASDRKTCWACGASGSVYRTTDGGTTWTSFISGASNNLRSISAVDSQAAIAVGEGGTVVITGDGGTTWYALPSGTTVKLFGVSALDAGRAFAVGEGGTILHFFK